MLVSSAVDTYAEWRRSALRADKRSGADRWKRRDRSSDFDYPVIRGRLDELREVRASGDAQRLLYYFEEGMHGNMGGMGGPALYRRSSFGTKHLISDYVLELSEGLQQLADADGVRPRRKLDFFRQAKRAYGDCALMLSGAGSLGPFHIGVARALLSQRLLPDVVSGSSAGAIVAAGLCARKPMEVEQLLDGRTLAGLFADLSASTQGSTRADVDFLRHVIETWIPDVTFAEALESSGRHLNVSVAPASLHQQSRTLSAQTAANVLVREAVMASCAIPGVFPAVRLQARSPSGKRVPYVQSRSWVDGSVTDDLPRGRLARLYGCNFFITSQTNPVVLWALQDPDGGPWSQLLAVQQAAAKEWYRALYPFAMRAVENVYPLNVMTRMWFSVLTQDYTADVNIIPSQRVWDPAMLLARLTPDQSEALVAEGQDATWPQIERIRNSTEVGRTLTSILAQLEPAPRG